MLPEAKRKTVSLPRESFVPLLQADVGSSVSISVYRYRVLVPVAQVIRESARAVRRVEVATEGDIYTIRNTLIRHFGGVTVLHQPPAPAFGVGARDPADVAGTLEQNEHVAFEVYAAPVQEADDYFRALRRELEEALLEGVILVEKQRSPCSDHCWAHAPAGPQRAGSSALYGAKVWTEKNPRRLLPRMVFPFRFVAMPPGRIWRRRAGVCQSANPRS
jgi:hypothetical protein